MNYHTCYGVRYNLVSVWRQTEVAVTVAAHDILNEDVATPDHAKRAEWANWALNHSDKAFPAFSWSVASNDTILTSVEVAPDGSTVKDTDIQFVVNSAIELVIAGWIPPTTAA
jgi:hypothetical protein